MPIIEETIRLGLRTKYRGTSVIKVGRDVARHLHPLGWRVVHLTQHYTYLLPPEGHRGRTVALRLTVPDPREIVGLALTLHMDAAPYRGELDGWPVRYEPRQEGTRRWRVTSWEGASRIEEEPYADPAEFHVGDLVWSVGARWENGDTEDPRWLGM